MQGCLDDYVYPRKAAMLILSSRCSSSARSSVPHQGSLRKPSECYSRVSESRARQWIKGGIVGVRRASTLHSMIRWALSLDATSTQASLESIIEQGSRSGDLHLDALGIRLVKRGFGRIVNVDDELTLKVKRTLRIQSAVNGPFGLFWPVTFFAVTELGELRLQTRHQKRAIQAQIALESEV
ncbi:BZ3500_MvSof-1268-A1-R1_Chr11-1g03130 [Microbotryum saponariae]|uniref:BZ3500_MvSof-1268-A1-R1_Chr11-1g03130 protein n=1 Tax=Microbotryum saponariae TaxID=289078 RepID=A0A2X0LF26_9BASI|nr:BZ3501_MvSof-1269-A2-R1_Chr11g02705 [Microbotryum saponariae]SDA03690.1 BZ3500_MvSof-1268-A1-R1_Chr11-1g03130 [Microbotryum saponariae]